MTMHAVMTTMDYNVPAHASRLMQSFLAKHQITQVTQPLYSLDLVPCDLWLFPKLKSPLKGRDFRPSLRFRKIWRGSWWRLVPRYLLWRGLRRHCPMYSVSRVSVDNELLEQCWPALFDVVNDPSVSILGKNRYLSIFLGFWLLISGNYFIYFF